MEKLKCLKKTLFLCLSVLFCCLFCLSSSVSAVDAVLPVRGFAHDVEIRSGCTAYTDVAQIDSSECSFWSTNLGWRRFDLKDVNVTSGWYYQFYLNVYVESLTEPGTTPLIQTNPVQSINNSFDVVSYNQVAANTYQGGFVNSTAKAGYSYTYSVIVRANETTLNASIRLGSSTGTDIFQHLSAGTGEYVTANFQISRLHAFEPIDYSSQLSDIISAINNISLSQASMEQAVEDGIGDAEENQKEQYEQQAEDNEDDIDADSSAAQSTATSLTSVLTQFLGILTSARPTNCVLNGDLMPHLPLGQLDLCQNSPPAAITALGSLVLIAFVVPLAYHLVKRMLALIGSFQS